jgi:hypothetical protein
MNENDPKISGDYYLIIIGSLLLAIFLGLWRLSA